VLSYNFPPGRGSGVYRGRAWVNHLARRGHDVSVLTVDPRYYPRVNGVVDPDLARTVDPAVRRLLVRMPSEFLVQDVRKMSWLHASWPLQYGDLWRSLPQRFFPEVYGHAYPLMAARGLRAALRHGRPDVVVATGNPYAQLAAGAWLARRFRARFVVDFHDAWTLNQFTEQDAFPRDHPAWAWERRLVDQADYVVTVNDPLADWYRETYPADADKVRVVENGFAEDVVHDLGYRPADPAAPLRFAYVGTIRPDLPLEEFREGWRLACEDPALAGATFDYYGYLGFFDRGASALLDRLGAGEDGISYAGPVPQTELDRVYRDVDVLAMLTPSSRFVTAGKVYDYMAAGRPVVGVHHARNHSTDAFADYPVFAGSGTVEPADIARALVAAAGMRRSMDESTYTTCRAEALRHTWDAALSPLADELEEGRRG
jgi:glycosyltransferase involved in cell wall biosynthesis